MMDAAAMIADRGWLEVVRGGSSVLLIAPHGGRAGAAAEAKLHPKINDLETAAISRTLARRLDATALINCGMDRNELDCNRLGQLAARTPWLLEMIADEVTKIVSRCGRAIVLLIHGWNIIEPRVDFGFGLKATATGLCPTPGAHVSASNDFICGPASELASRLRAAGIIPTFGLRYPGGAAQNLLQVFTPRHLTSENPAVRRLALLAREGQIDAAQLELSVTLRLPGPARDKALEAITYTFNGAGQRSKVAASIEIVRQREAAPRKMTKGSDAPPLRIGVEFYDPVARLGGIASFDFGPNAAGGRIMMLFEGRRVALFTGEGGATRSGSRISLGPLSFDGGAEHSRLQFKGPAVIVDDGTAYLSVEGALAEGRLDPEMEIDATLGLQATTDFGELMAKLEEIIEHRSEGDKTWADLERAVPVYPAFGRLQGIVKFDGVTRAIKATARAGISFTALGPQKFLARRMLWICPNEISKQDVIELRELETEPGYFSRSASLLRKGTWRKVELKKLKLEASQHEPSEEIAVELADGAVPIRLNGTPDTFMTLSRPGAGGTRIHTSLGFANYRIAGMRACGMYEYSRIAATQPAETGFEDND
jgi:hypothetical protein